MYCSESALLGLVGFALAYATGISKQNCSLHRCSAVPLVCLPPPFNLWPAAQSDCLCCPHDAPSVHYHSLHHNSQPNAWVAPSCKLTLPCREVPSSVSVDGFLQVSPQIVTWEGISCKVTQGHSGQQRQILHSISGVAAVRGEGRDLVPCLFAVLGPSGAGKTTFMDILSGRKRDSGQSSSSGCTQTCYTVVQMLPCLNVNVCIYMLPSTFMPPDVRIPSGPHFIIRVSTSTTMLYRCHYALPVS